MSATLSPRFQAGGAVQEGAFYARRLADDLVYEALAAGEVCHLLGPRRIGKSSLRIRVAQRLRARGIRCATVDLSMLGTPDREDLWYATMALEIGEELGLDATASRWRQTEERTPVSRFARFLREVVLRTLPESLVLFFDEIDSTLTLPFRADDFFSALRALYGRRAEDSDCRRLTFCLLGVALPDDLGRDPAHTPFNIGLPVRLKDLSMTEAQVFLPGLRDLPGGAGEAWLSAVLEWTGGHPYMTQALCSRLLRESRAGRLQGPEDVERVVREQFIRSGPVDASLNYAERYFRDRSGDKQQAQLLQLYLRLLGGEDVPARPADSAQQRLLLTGMVAEQGEEHPVLHVRNRIFAAVFNERWVREQMRSRQLAEQLAGWLASNRAREHLLFGEESARAQEWAEAQHDLTEEENAYLRASLEQARRLEEEHARREEERARKEEEHARKEEEHARREHRLRQWAVGLGLAFSLALGMLAVTFGDSYYQKREIARYEAEEGLFICRLNTAAQPCTAAFLGVQRRCSEGNLSACTRLGLAYQNGIGVSQNSETATAVLSRACDGGDGAGCHELGLALETTDAKEKAFALFKRSCDLGFQAGCVSLGYFLEHGKSTAPDVERAHLLYKQACDAGYTLGCNNLAFLQEQSAPGNSGDSASTAELYRRACDHNIGLACLNLGYLYERGRTGAPGLSERERLHKAQQQYQRACELQDPVGCANLGFLFEAEQPEKAAAAYRKACEAGYSRGCNNLGVLSESGRGVRQDALEAAMFYKKACTADYALGCLNLSGLLRSGKGVARDPEEAERYKQRSCALDPQLCSKP